MLYFVIGLVWLAMFAVSQRRSSVFLAELRKFERIGFAVSTGLAAVSLMILYRYSSLLFGIMALLMCSTLLCWLCAAPSIPLQMDMDEFEPQMPKGKTDEARKKQSAEAEKASEEEGKQSEEENSFFADLLKMFAKKDPKDKASQIAEPGKQKRKRYRAVTLKPGTNDPGSPVQWKSVKVDMQKVVTPEKKSRFVADWSAADFFMIPDGADRLQIDGHPMKVMDLREARCTFGSSGNGELQFSGDPVITDVLKKGFRFTPSYGKMTRKTLFLFWTALAEVIGLMFCFAVSRHYMHSTTDTKQMLAENTAAVSATVLPEASELGAMYVDKANSDVYAENLPDVHIIVIEKEGGRYLPEVTDAKTATYMNPAELNTVLMFYQDKLTDRLRETEKENAPKIDTVYYNFTELYMNLPIRTTDKDPHVLGEIFDGTLTYDGKTGFPAVRSWFRDMYRVNVASFTAIPQTVFAELYGTEPNFGISLNDKFVRFLKKNYCGGENPSYSVMTKKMLSEAAVLPVFSEECRKRIETLAGKLIEQEATGFLKEDAVLFLNGEDLIAFANTVRAAGTDPEEDDSVISGMTELADYSAVQTIVHSNWDLVLETLLESMTELKNSTHSIFCTESHAETLSQIRTSLPDGKLSEFAERLIRIGLPADMSEDTDKKTSAEQIIFSVRNLDLKMYSPANETNEYLLRRIPKKSSSYLNREIYGALYFCLSEEKIYEDKKTVRSLKDVPVEGEPTTEAPA